MKWKFFVVTLVSLLVVSVVASGRIIPANDKAIDKAKAPENSPVINESWDLEVGGPRALIGFTRVPGPSEQALVRGHGGVIKYSYNLVPAIAASIPETAIAGLLQNPGVTSIEPDSMVYALDAELDNSWGVKRIGVGEVHDSGNFGTGVKIAIIDTGIDYTHPDLDDNCADENGDGIIDGYDFVNSDADPMDDEGHGTHVAGSAAAEKDDVGVVGVAPEAALYALKVLDETGSGYWSDVIAAMQWAVDNGIEVANLSLGASRNPGGTVQAAFDNAEAAGLVIVAAAGNSGNRKGKGNNVEYPARYDSVIAAAATDEIDNRASWSSTGDQVELAAPGVSINSTLPDGAYGKGSGTSMASPHVAGTAALVIAAGITDWNANLRINDEVRQVMNDTAIDLGDPGRDTLYGFGLVDAYVAVLSVTPPATGFISGKVTDADTTAAIVGATVTDGTRTTTTDSEGTYILVDVPKGTYMVTASATGYNSATQTDVVVTADMTTTINFALTPIKTGSIAGTVTNASNGLAISGAMVTVDTSQLATTAPDGTYIITDVPTGERSATASADGFESQTKTAPVIEGQTTTVDFALNQVPADVAIITKAEYKRRTGELNVEATSSEGSSGVILRVYGYDGEKYTFDYGEMTYDSRKNKYKLKVKSVADPGGFVVVISNLGGSATKQVKYK